MPEIAIYTRISQADPEEQTATQRQERSCRAYAEARGWTVSQVFEDVDLSAYRRIQRPAYERMMRAIADGQVGGVLVWKLDRLMRRSSEFERFWLICEKAGASLASVTEPLDSSTELGRAVIRVLVTFAALESATKAERLTAKFAEMAANGAPPVGGRRSFGMNKSFTRVVPKEAALVREAASRVLDGESMTSIAVDWKRRGIRGTCGGEWGVRGLKRLLTNPYLVADREYKGRVVAHGHWPPILDRETFENVGAVLRSRRHPAHHVYRYLLSGLMRCGTCGGRVSGTGLRGYRNRRAYRCSPPPRGCGRSGTDAERTDEWVLKQVIAYLDGDHLREATAAMTRRSLASLDAQSVTIQLRQLADDHYVRKTIDRKQYARLRRNLEAKRDRLQSSVETELRMPKLLALVGNGRTVAARWPDTPLSERQAIIGAAIDHITIRDVPVRGNNNFQPRRFAIVWRL